MSNYSKKMKNDKNRKGKKQGSTFKKIIMRIVSVILTLMLIGFISGTIIVGAFAIYVKNYLDSSVEGLDVLLTSQDLTTTLYYVDYSEDEFGVYKELESESLHGSENRVWVSYSELPQNLINAFVSIEDHKFFDHNGVDWKRTIGATVNFLLPFGGHYGGSTITQQIIKNITDEDDVTIQRKVQEILRALNLEKVYEKEQLLELYLNTIYLSHQCYGVKAAAMTYFNKDVSELTLAECATLAAIPKAPTTYDPILNPDKSTERRNDVLFRMNELGKISDEEYEAACDEELVTNYTTAQERGASNSWYTDLVIDDVIEALMEEYGWTKEIASQKLYTGGLKIITAQDPEIQAILEEVYADDSNFPLVDSVIQPESAMVIINPYNGNVVASVGGRGEKTQNRILNRTTHTTRSPGSSIKPLSVYTPGIESNIITYSTVFDDVPVNFGNNPENPVAWPSNAPNVYKGLTTVYDALQRSVNTVSLRILDNVGIEKSFDFVTEELHMDSFIERLELTGGRVVSDKNQSALGLGGMTYGVTVEEITAAYSIFVNNGVYTKPRTFLKVLDNEGNVIIDNESESNIVISEETMTIMTKMLENVVDYGTAKDVTLKNKIDVAGKTGTTNNDYDRWFIGYTPYYVGGVWFGFDNQKSLSSVSKNPGTTIWNTVMTKVHEKILERVDNGEEELKTFNRSENLTEVSVCRDSGLLPTEACSLDPRGSRVVTSYFKKGTVPSSSCSTHVLVDYDSSTSAVAGKGCPDEYITQVALIRVENRNFPKQIVVEDAQYVYRYLPDNVEPGGWWGEPYFINTIPEGVYVGTNNVESVYNHYCYQHYNMKNTESETDIPETEETTDELESDTDGLETDGDNSSADTETDAVLETEGNTVESESESESESETERKGPPEGYVW